MTRIICLWLSSTFCWSTAFALSCSPSQVVVQNEFKPHLRAKIANGIAKSERRARERAAETRQNCDRCYRPPALCVCEALPDQRIITKTSLLVLQHPNERRKKNFSTVPLLRLVLENVQVLVGCKFESEQIAPLVEALQQDRQPLLLFPGPGSMPLDELRLSVPRPDESANSFPQPETVLSDENLVIVVDGTWTEAKNILRDSPTLVNKCKLVQFANEATSIYNSIREEPKPHCMSTLEACSKVLQLLEPSPETDVAVNYLQEVLALHVNFHLVNTRMMAPRKIIKSTARLYAKNKRRREIELKLFAGRELKSSKTESLEMDSESRPKQPVNLFRTLKDGAVLRSLTPSDACLVNSWWEYRNSKSLSLVSRRIEVDQGVACLGIEIDGKLVACILRYEGGALGMLHVETEYRRRGYGLALLQHATQTLKEHDQERVAFIIEGNHVSETVFEAAGWKRVDHSRGRRTGIRRAKGKWVHV